MYASNMRGKLPNKNNKQPSSQRIPTKKAEVMLALAFEIAVVATLI